MAGKVLHAALVGVSTLLGKELLNEIGDSAAAAWDLRLLEEGDAVEGQLTSAGDEALVIHSLSETSFNGVDLVLFASPAALTEKYLPSALTAGAAVVDLSGVTNGRQGFVLRSPWIEGSPRPDLMTAGITVPHAAALMLALTSERLRRKFGRAEIRATVLEPASQAGAAGVDELHQQTVSLLSFQDVPKEVFDAQIAFNLQAQLGTEARKDLRATRQQITSECRALLGANDNGSVSLNLVQAPVFHGYYISAYVQLREGATPEAVSAALAGGIVSASEDTVPSNQAAVEAGDVLASVEGDSEAGASGVWLTLAADNLRLSARSGVQAALELAALRPGSRVQ